MFQELMFRREHLMRWAIGVAFVLVVCCIGWNVPGYDLRASYVAGRLVAAGQAGHIYDQVGRDSAHEGRSAWAEAALQGGIPDREVTAYVQGPLWAWLVAPVADRLNFIAFRRVFLALMAAATVGLVFSATRAWTPALATPLGQGCLLAALLLTTPFYAGIVLGQTHILFLYIVTRAIIAEQRGRALLAGVLLALGAYTKITPVWVALTWLARGNWRAAVSFAVSSACLLLATLIAGGWRNAVLFAQILEKTGRSTLLSFNNDSLASVLLHGALTPDTAFHFQPVDMPGWLSGVSIMAVAAVAVGMGFYDRSRRGGQVGPIFTLVAATAFTPLAWNHYFVVLVLPASLFVDFAMRHQAMRWVVLAAAIVVLNLPPLSYMGGSNLWIVALRSQFWAAMLCLLAIPVLPRERANFQFEQPLAKAP